MATHNLFKGIKRVLANNTAYTATTNNDYLYFVRTATTDLEGDIWFQGVHYGHFGANDLTAIETALAGFLTGQGGQGYKNVKQYIDDAIAELAGKDSYASGESADKHVKVEVEIVDSELTAVTVTTTDIASAAELEAVEGSLGFNGTAYTQTDNNYISGDTVAADIKRLDTVLGTLNDNLGDIEDALATTAATLTNMIEAEEDAREAAIEALDYSGVTQNGQAIVNVTETNGVITATQGDIAAEHVTIADAGELFTATNVEDALAEIVAAYKAADEAIVGDATESGNTLGKLEDRIEALDAEAKEYHLVKTTTGLPETIKERYSLVDADGHVSGDTVDIPKDSHIVSITYITTSGDPHYQNLEYVYIDASGNNQTVYVDMSQLVLESEFASGVTSIDGVVRGVVDPTSETFLTVGADGFKLDGVQDAIDDAVEAEENARKQADSAITEDLETTAATLVQMIEDAQASATTEVVEGTDAGNNLSIVESAGADGQKIYTVNLSDVASASALTQEISDRGDADEALQAEIDTIEAGVGLTSGGTWTPGSGQYTSASTSVADAINKLDAAITESESDWEDALAEEIAARESGDTQLHNALTAETSAREEADEALDGRLDAIEEKYLTGVTVNGVDATVSANTATVTIDAGDIEVGAAITGETVNTEATDKVDEVLQAIVTALDAVDSGAYTGLTSSDDSLILSGTTNGQDIIVNREDVTLTEAQDGHIELLQNNSGELYGAMYWIDEETA